ncbi:UDP-N-acetylmuramate dehydrogenase [Marinilongibacter aquaticus]|uniref:UDP-N-acetylmuramate dehydrogenase n=1 Tax=Marinilongibacter aquaticus TaxID=2975157 RepID=UPI0021BD0D02|nr:UDP-N-acetylmuramate dehydrogenase [Marinilongibacter aquaticus]UBM57363.1 UDP-N-acetylmuramate dehydrogenase [Marinilongibacter aquaticus]
MPNILKNISLKSLNTFGLDCKAQYFVEINAIEEMRELVANPLFQSQRILILGGGSNILLTQDFEGLVIKNNISGIELVEENAEHFWVKVGAGEVWHNFVMHSIEKQWAGIENLALIPGTVGAAPMQNIGAYGVEIKDVFWQLEALNLSTREIEIFDHAACAFGYRESVFKHSKKGQYMICRVGFKLNKGVHLHLEYGAILETLKSMHIVEPSIKDVASAVIAIRQSKLPDPKKIGNSGSFFKNPVVPTALYSKLKAAYPDMPAYIQDDQLVKIPAGWLIEQAGWKGKRLGEIGVHDKQALVLVNYGAGKGNDLVKLAQDIQHSVLEKFGVTLHPEVNII